MREWRTGGMLAWRAARTGVGVDMRLPPGRWMSTWLTHAPEAENSDKLPKEYPGWPAVEALTATQVRLMRRSPARRVLAQTRISVFGQAKMERDSRKSKRNPMRNWCYSPLPLRWPPPRSP